MSLVQMTNSVQDQRMHTLVPPFKERNNLSVDAMTNISK